MMRNIVNALFIRHGKVLLARRSPHRRAYPGLWSFPGGHVEQHETRAEALVREVREEVGVVPISFSFLVSIADPNASESDPATYHFYSVSAWEGGEPTLFGDEHIELKWCSAPMAIALPDLALDEYRTLLGQYVRSERATDLGSRRPGLVIFDCDGVLVDSELIETRIRSECLRAAGFPVTAEELGSNSGISGRNLIEMIENRFGRPLPEGFMAATRAKIMSAFTEELRAIEGVSELLQSLTVPVCVASNSHPDRVRHSLEVTDLWQFFDPYVFSATMVSRGKPAPDLFLLAAERLNAYPSNCLVVEDSIYGVMAAQAAGMNVVGFCGGSHCQAGHADRLLGLGCMEAFACMAELTRFLKDICCR